MKMVDLETAVSLQTDAMLTSYDAMLTSFVSSTCDHDPVKKSGYIFTEQTIRRGG